MPDHLCANSITGGVEYWLVRRYTSRDVNIQSHFEESSTLFLKIILISLTTLQIIPNGLLMVGSTDLRQFMTSHAPANLCNRSVGLITFNLRFGWFIARVETEREELSRLF